MMEMGYMKRKRGGRKEEKEEVKKSKERGRNR